MKTITITEERLDEMAIKDVTALITPMLKDGDFESDYDETATATWIDAGGKEWEIEGFIMLLGTEKAVLWTDDDQVGVDDIVVINHDDDLKAEIAGHVALVAAGLG